MTNSDPHINTSNELNTVNQDNPWPGLLPYNETDQQFFHGRDTESAKLTSLVLREILTVLFGLSGLGKSSLLQAGLFPLLRQYSILPVYIRLAYPADVIGLRTQVKEALLSEAHKVGIQTSDINSEQQTLWEIFHHQDADFWNERNEPVIPLLVFDQFEEIFTLGKIGEDQFVASKLFLDELSDFIEGRPSASLKLSFDKDPEQSKNFNFSRHYYKVLLSLREDFIPDLEELRVKMPSVIINRMRLHRMNGNAALDVVVKPHHLIDAEVAKKVVQFVAAESATIEFEKLEIEPALLSVVCRELNNKRQKNNGSLITEKLFEGSRDEILSEFYERCVNDLAPEVRAFIEDKLLTVSGYRDSIAIENALNIPGISIHDINLLMNRRLIRKEEHAGLQRLELTHDLLTRVISSSRNSRRLKEAHQQQKSEIIQKERQQRLEERAKNARLMRWLSAALAILFLFAMFAFFQAWKEKKIAQKQQVLAEQQKVLADEAEKKASQIVKKLMESIKLRQVILSGNNEALDEAFKKTKVETTIEFKATALEKPYKSKDGSPTYLFKMFPSENNKAGELKNIALITYIMDNPTFVNRLISSGPDTKFSGSYEGVGCLSQVTAVIEYYDIDKPLTISKFDMCELLEFVK